MVCISLSHGMICCTYYYYLTPYTHQPVSTIAITQTNLHSRAGRAALARFARIERSFPLSRRAQICPREDLVRTASGASGAATAPGSSVSTHTIARAPSWQIYSERTLAYLRFGSLTAVRFPTP